MKNIDIILVAQAIDVIAECSGECNEDILGIIENAIIDAEDCGKIRMINRGECMVELMDTEDPEGWGGEAIYSDEKI